jgi:hypothetical protein
MNASFFFEVGKPLAHGLVEEELATWDREMAGARLTAAFPLVGMDKALSIARRLGDYELSPELVRRLELEGLELGKGGTLPALSPGGWAPALHLDTYSDLRARIEQQGGELKGLRLNERDRESFRRFLEKQKVPDTAGPWELTDIARHFFFQVSLKLVVSYTAPSFHRQ